MRKSLLYALLFIGSFVLPSCGDDEDDTPKPAAHPIEGTWEIRQIRSQLYDNAGNPVGIEKDERSRGTFMEFAGNNIYKERNSTNPPQESSGVYSVSNSNLVTHVTQPTAKAPINYTIDTLSTTRLVIRTTIPVSGGTGNLVAVYHTARQ